MTRTRRKKMNNSPEIMTEEQVYETVTLEEAADSLDKAENTLILTHVNPDGDCIGSAFALRDIILALGKDASVANPSVMPKRLKFLSCQTGEDCPEDGEVPHMSETDEESLSRFDRIISVDVASPIQLDKNAFLIPQISLMIDHHGMGEPFAKNYIDPCASAAGEIVYEMYAYLKSIGKLSSVPDAARKMYAAIVSDTGSFKFSNTTKKTHLIAAELLEEINSANDGGMDTSDVCRSLFGQRTLKELTAQMLAIQNLRFYNDRKLGAVLFTQDMLEEAGLTENDIGNVVDTPRGVEGVLVGISLRQLSEDRRFYKVSSRANAEIDCAAVCAAHGGGGHVRAAGCTIEADSPEEALDMMTKAFGEAVEKYAAEKEAR